MTGWLPAPAEELFGPEATADESYDLLTVDVPAASWITALETARTTLGCTYFDWLSAVDEGEAGFRVSAHVVALGPVRRLLVRTAVPREAAVLPSAVGVYAGAAWHERETHEMFGVGFDGHPGLDPLLLPETFEGHPLRKDFVLAARVVKAWPGAKEPGESEHGGPKRRQMLPPGVPDPNEWGPSRASSHPPRPVRPAARRAARAAPPHARPGTDRSAARVRPRGYGGGCGCRRGCAGDGYGSRYGRGTRYGRPGHRRYGYCCTGVRRPDRYADFRYRYGHRGRYGGRTRGPARPQGTFRLRRLRVPAPRGRPGPGLRTGSRLRFAGVLGAHGLRRQRGGHPRRVRRPGRPAPHRQPRRALAPRAARLRRVTPHRRQPTGHGTRDHRTRDHGTQDHGTGRHRTRGHETRGHETGQRVPYRGQGGRQGGSQGGRQGHGPGHERSPGRGHEQHHGPGPDPDPGPEHGPGPEPGPGPSHGRRHPWRSAVNDALDVALRLLVVFAVFLVLPLVVGQAEHKVMAHMQGRLGPMYAGGFHGWAQLVADGVKFAQKEDIVPARADRKVFQLAPAVALLPYLLVLLAIPIGPGEGAVGEVIDAGIFFVLAVMGVSVLGSLMAGWASANKFSLLGGLRTAAQLLSYELPMLLAAASVAMAAGTVSLPGIVAAFEWWWLPWQIVGAIVFFVAGLAELQRPPFDMPVADSEIIFGAYTEYTGLRFALFLLAEYAGIVVLCGLTTVLFLGGWHGPLGADGLGWVWTLLKTAVLAFVVIWLRVTYPRLREDQLQRLAWTTLVPLALAQIALTGVVKVVM